LISNNAELIRYVELGAFYVLLYFSVEFWLSPDFVGDDIAV